MTYGCTVGYIGSKNYDTLSNLRWDGYNTKDGAALFLTHHIQITRGKVDIALQIY